MDDKQKIFEEMLSLLEARGLCLYKYHHLGCYMFPEMAYNEAYDYLQVEELKHFQ